MTNRSKKKSPRGKGPHEDRSSAYNMIKEAKEEAKLFEKRSMNFIVKMNTKYSYKNKNYYIIYDFVFLLYEMVNDLLLLYQNLMGYDPETDSECKVWEKHSYLLHGQIYSMEKLEKKLKFRYEVDYPDLYEDIYNLKKYIRVCLPSLAEEEIFNRTTGREKLRHFHSVAPFFDQYSEFRNKYGPKSMIKSMLYSPPKMRKFY